MQNVQVPIDGDADAIKKYADEMQRIKKQVGVICPEACCMQGLLFKPCCMQPDN